MKVTLFILSVLSAFALAHGPDDDGDMPGMAMPAAPKPTAPKVAPLPIPKAKPSTLPKLPKAAAPKPAGGMAGMAGMSHGHGGM